MCKKVFVSYARPDQDSAQRLVGDLRGAGFEVWFDQDSLLPGQSWKVEITRAIRQSDCFVALLSTQSVDRRGYVQKELVQALDVLDKCPLNQIFLIPTRIDNCEIIHPRLGDLQWIDLFPDWNRAVNRIIMAITS